MLRLKLIEETDTRAVYGYFPEEEKENGSLSIDKRTGEIQVVEVAKSDTFNRYLHHAVSRVEQYYKNNNYLEIDTVAWY